MTPRSRWPLAFAAPGALGMLAACPASPRLPPNDGARERNARGTTWADAVSADDRDRESGRTAASASAFASAAVPAAAAPARAERAAIGATGRASVVRLVDAPDVARRGLVAGGGPLLAAPGARLADERLATTAVRRLLELGQMRCTGTLVRRRAGASPSPYVFVTAAHCVHRIDPDGRLGPILVDLTVEGLAKDALDRPRVSRAFSRCADAHETFTRCLDQGAADFAYIPVKESALDGQVVWDECTKSPNDQTFVVYGYGLRRGGRDLVRGSFDLDARSGSGPWTAIGEAYRVAEGDSGGPVITLGDAGEMSSLAPRVCFTVSAIRFRTFEDPSGETSRAFLQPAWGDEAWNGE